MDIKSEVLKYIDLAEDTAKALLQMHLTDMSDQNYNESLELIKELRETVSGVWDNSTVAAMKKAKEVEDCILRWMKCASTMTCSTGYVRELRSAVEKAREWGTLNKAAEGRGIFGLGKNKDTARAAEEDIKKEVAYSGKIKIVSRAERAVRGVTVLQESLIAAERLLQREKDNFKEVYSTDELEAQIAANMDYSQRLQLLNFLVMIAQADGSVPRGEVDALREVARCMGLADSELDSMLKLSGGTLDDAYAVLGVSPDATDDEVRRAYRTLALKHHPDRVAALGDDIRRAAEKKFQEINEAKERIYKARGM